jgi:hypothetical protein
MATPTAKFESVKLGQFVTPVGSALFVSSPHPSQYDALKEEASILLSSDDWAILKAQIDAKLVELNGYKLVAEKNMKYPIKEAVDKEGNETGDIILKSKTSIKYPAKFVDGNGKSFVPGDTFSVANRSKIRLAVGFEVVNTALYKGLVARLNAIKIISTSDFGGANQFEGIDDEGDYSYNGDAETPVVPEADVDWAED